MLVLVDTGPALWPETRIFLGRVLAARRVVARDPQVASDMMVAPADRVSNDCIGTAVGDAAEGRLQPAPPPVYANRTLWTVKPGPPWASSVSLVLLAPHGSGH